MATRADRERWLRYRDRSASTLGASTRFMDRVLAGEHFCRRPLRMVTAMGLQVQRRERFALVVVERLAACRPVGAPADEDGSA